MESFDFFISHSSKTKELAKHIWFMGTYNNLSAWYDENLLHGGDKLREKIQLGINSSNAFLLLHCKEAIESVWVKEEMEIAKFKKEGNEKFKIIVIKLDDYPIDDWWKTFKFEFWNHADVPLSMFKLFEALTGKKILMELTNAALLSNLSGYFVNETNTIAEQTKNLMLYYFSHIKYLLHTTATQGYPQELKSTIDKVLKLYLVNLLPTLTHGMPFPIGDGIWEYIYGVRMRRVPQVIISELPKPYKHEVVFVDEISLRLRIKNEETEEVVNHIVPFKLALSAEL